MRIKADFELRCHEYEGVEAIKAALFAGEAKSRDKCEVKVIIFDNRFINYLIKLTNLFYLGKVWDYWFACVCWMYKHLG